MITYLDSSFIVRAYLPDEPDHVIARELVDDNSQAVVTGSWSRVEVTSALVRAAGARRGGQVELLAFFEEDISPISGNLTVVDASHAEIERVSLDIVTRHAIRSMDAWHLACASLAFADLAEPHEQCVFATRDAKQAMVALELGMAVL